MNDTSKLPLHLAAGLAILLACAAAFHTLAGAWGPGAPMARLDAQVAHWLHAHAFEPLTTLLLGLTHLHSVAGVAVLGLLFGLWLWRRGQRRWLALLLLAVPPGMLLNVLLKHLYQRPRPSFAEPLLTLSTYSFPSGHTLTATVLYGVLACYLWRRPAALPVRAAGVAAAALMVLLVAFSRLYLGAHYLSDVLAAMLEGLGWLVICVSGVHAMRWRGGA